MPLWQAVNRLRRDHAEFVPFLEADAMKQLARMQEAATAKPNTEFPAEYHLNVEHAASAAPPPSGKPGAAGRCG